MLRVSGALTASLASGSAVASRRSLRGSASLSRTSLKSTRISSRSYTSAASAAADGSPNENKPKPSRASKKAAASSSEGASVEPKLPSSSKKSRVVPPAEPAEAPTPPVAAPEAAASESEIAPVVADTKMSRRQKRKQKLQRKKKRDVEKLSTTLKAKAEATAQDYASLTEKLATVLSKMTVKAKDNAAKVSFDKFPWLIDEKTKKVLILAAHRYLTVSPRPILATKSAVVGESTTPTGMNPKQSLAVDDSTPQYNSASAWRDSAGLLIRGTAEDVTGIYLRDIARAIAAQYKADFLEFDISRIHKEQAHLLQLSAQERGLAVYKYSRKRYESRFAQSQVAASSEPPAPGTPRSPSNPGNGGTAPIVSTKPLRTHGEGSSAPPSAASNVSSTTPSAAPQQPHPSDGSNGTSMMDQSSSQQISPESFSGVLDFIEVDSTGTLSLDQLQASHQSLPAVASTSVQDRFAAKLENFLKSPRGGGGSGGGSGGSPGKPSGSGSGSGSNGHPVSQHRQNLFRLGKQIGDLSRGALWHVLLDSIFEAAARDPSQTPRVIYLRRAHLIPPPLLEYLRKKRHQYIANGIPILFVGSCLDPPVSREDDSMETVLRDIRSSVRPGRRGILDREDEEEDDDESGMSNRDEDEDDENLEEDDEDAFLADPDAFDVKAKRRAASELIVIPPRGRIRYKAEARKKALSTTFSPQFLVSSPSGEPHLRDTWATQLQEQLKASTGQANLVRILDAFRFAGLRLQVSGPAQSPAAAEAASVAATAAGQPQPEIEATAEAKLGIVPYARKLSLLLLGDLTPSAGRQRSVTPICSAEAAVFLTGRRLSALAARNIMEIAVGCARQVGASSVSLSHLAEALELVRQTGADNAPNGPVTHERLEAIANELNDAERELKNSVVHPSSIATTFDDIGALDSAKHELESLFTPFRLARIFHGVNPLVKAPSGVLLYGPPGTGKTMLARAVAKQAGATFIHISPSNINSKWFGAAERNVAAVFSLAQKLSPSIVFIDEIDSFLSSRSSGDHEATARVKTEFMSNWDGIKNNNEMSRSVIVMGATNRPFDLDLAVLRRLPHRILIDLPDVAARTSILAKILRQVSLDAKTLPKEVLSGPLSESVEEQKAAFVAYLAKATEGYSGSDLHNLCTTAANMIVRDILSDKDYKPNASVEVIEEIARRHVNRPLGYEDFSRAFSQVKPSVDDQDRSITMLRTWQKSFGMGKKVSIGF